MIGFIQLVKEPIDKLVYGEPNLSICMRTIRWAMLWVHSNHRIMPMITRIERRRKTEEKPLHGVNRIEWSATEGKWVVRKILQSTAPVGKQIQVFSMRDNRIWKKKRNHNHWLINLINMTLQLKVKSASNDNRLKELTLTFMPSNCVKTDYPSQWL